MITPAQGGVYIDLHVQANARQPGVRGLHGDRLKLAVAAPAQSGQANAAVVGAIADLLGVPQSAVSLVSGKATRQKRVYVGGVKSTDAHRLIMAAVA